MLWHLCELTSRQPYCKHLGPLWPHLHSVEGGKPAVASQPLVQQAESALVHFYFGLQSSVCRQANQSVASYHAHCTSLNTAWMLQPHDAANCSAGQQGQHRWWSPILGWRIPAPFVTQEKRAAQIMHRRFTEHSSFVAIVWTAVYHSCCLPLPLAAVSAGCCCHPRAACVCCHSAHGVLQHSIQAITWHYSMARNVATIIYCRLCRHGHSGSVCNRTRLYRIPIVCMLACWCIYRQQLHQSIWLASIQVVIRPWLQQQCRSTSTPTCEGVNHNHMLWFPCTACLLPECCLHASCTDHAIILHGWQGD